MAAPQKDSQTRDLAAVPIIGEEANAKHIAELKEADAETQMLPDQREAMKEKPVTKTLDSRHQGDRSQGRRSPSPLIRTA